MIPRRIPVPASLGSVLVLLAGCGPGVDEPSLDRVRGVWETEDERYAGSSFTFGDENLFLLRTGDDVQACTVLELIVEENETSGAVEYDVTYADAEGNRVDFPFVYQADTEAIRFRGRPRTVWKRTERR